MRVTTACSVTHEGIARVFALQHLSKLEAFGQVDRHILERMHRELRAPFFERGLELLDEQAFAADLRERSVEDLVTARGHAQQRHGHAEALRQQVSHMLRLPQGEAAFTGRDQGGFSHWQMLAGASLAARRMTHLSGAAAGCAAPLLRSGSP